MPAPLAAVTCPCMETTTVSATRRMAILRPADARAGILPPGIGSRQHGPSFPPRFVEYGNEGRVGSLDTGAVSGGLDAAGIRIVATAPTAASSCQSTQNWTASGESGPLTTVM